MANQSNSSKRFPRISLSHNAESKEEVDDILKKAKAGGKSPMEPEKFEWGYAGYFKDPDGHLWEIVYFSK